MIIKTIRTIRTNDPMSCDCWDRICGVSSVKSQIKPRIVRRETFAERVWNADYIGNDNPLVRQQRTHQRAPHANLMKTKTINWICSGVCCRNSFQMRRFGDRSTCVGGIEF